MLLTLRGEGKAAASYASLRIVADGDGASARSVPARSASLVWALIRNLVCLSAFVKLLQDLVSEFP